ncbi:MAG: LPS-assembly protein LptD, partial [Bacteroidetes bacterium]|nr:LPS-assembly protein LptD [Bacteroidota bacterium]
MSFPSLAQDTITRNVFDTVVPQVINDSPDTIIVRGAPQLGLDANVEYQSKDSIRFNMISSEVFMYGDAEIKYDKIDLDAAFVKIDFIANELEAEGVKDSTGKLIGNPIFTQEDKVYNSKYMKYNYVTKKGYIKDVITEEGEGLLHGKEIKKLANDEILLKSGIFTTCTNEDHPHFGIKFNKAKAIQGKKMITGPAHLVVEGVSTPLIVPFGMFPNKTGQRSGIVMPSYGESASRGFFLEDGGYYWAINDYFTFKITGDIYSSGSWSINPVFNYKKRYKFQGSLNLSYAINKTGSDNQDVNKDFSIRWSHNQDAKARPNSRFSANVNIVSKKANLFNPTTTQDFLSNEFSSSISYQTTIAKKFKLSASANHSQNTQTKKVTLSLPKISLSAERFYPFRKKGKTGTLKWYDNISMNYRMEARNTVSIADSLLFQPEMFSQIKNGIQHSIPINSTVKILDVFNLTTSAKITDRMYFNRTEKHLVTETDENGKDTTYVQADTIPGFYNLIDFGFSANINTTFYGQKNFEKGALRAIRHVFKPSVGFSYTPDFSTDGWGYYDYYYTNEDHTDSTQYSYYDNQIYGKPSNRESGSITFGITNNLEIKVRSRKDTINGLKKIALIDQFTISTSYDVAKDSINWAPIRMSGRTRLFKKIDLNYSSTWSVYAADSAGNNTRQSEWKVNKKLLRLTSTSWKFG